MIIKTVAALVAIFVTGVFTLVNSNPGKYERDLLAHELTGNVKWCKYTELRISNNKRLKTDMERFYNNDGNVTKELFTYVPATKHRKHTDTVIITYDAENRRVLVEQTNQHLKSTQTYHYNQNHQLVEEFSIDGTPPGIITYNASGYRDSFIDYSIYGKFVFKVVYKYDDAGNNVEDTRYQANNAIDEKVIRTFNEKRQLLIEKHYDGNMGLNWKRSYSYDNDGNKVMQIDSALRMLRGVGYINKTANSVNNIDTYTYQYLNKDNHGNWLQKITRFNGEKTEEIKREIAYYQ